MSWNIHEVVRALKPDTRRAKVGREISQLIREIVGQETFSVVI